MHLQANLVHLYSKHFRAKNRLPLFLEMFPAPRILKISQMINDFFQKRFLLTSILPPELDALAPSVFYNLFSEEYFSSAREQ
jgi:hypothetical protein